MPRVLVVDDSSTQRMLARFILEEAGYEVLEATDGTGTLEIASQDPPDCILLDLHLEGDSGQDILQALSRRGISIPVVVSSSGVDEQTQRECLKLGAAAVIDKPGSSEQLDEVIKSVLGA